MAQARYQIASQRRSARGTSKETYSFLYLIFIQSMPEEDVEKSQRTVMPLCRGKQKNQIIEGGKPGKVQRSLWVRWWEEWLDTGRSSLHCQSRLGWELPLLPCVILFLYLHCTNLGNWAWGLFGILGIVVDFLSYFYLVHYFLLLHLFFLGGKGLVQSCRQRGWQETLVVTSGEKVVSTVA